MKIFLPFVLLVASIATLVYSLYVDSASRPRQEFAPAFDGEGIPGLTITRFTAEWHA